MSNNEETLSVVIPVYNESEIIEEVLRQWDQTLAQLNINYAIHIYNDGSKDNTLDTLKTLAQSMPRLNVHDKPNSGHGPTILQGFCENNTATWVFHVDSDNEMSPQYFENLWKARNDYDFLIGERCGRNSPISRRIISTTSSCVVRLFFGKGVCDVNAPYRLMRSKVFQKHWLNIPPNTFAPNVIISGLACRHKMRIFKTMVPYQTRTTGEVSIKKFKLFKAALQSFVQTIAYAKK